MIGTIQTSPQYLTIRLLNEIGKKEFFFNLIIYELFFFSFSFSNIRILVVLPMT